MIEPRALIPGAARECELYHFGSQIPPTAIPVFVSVFYGPAAGGLRQSNLVPFYEARRYTKVILAGSEFTHLSTPTIKMDRRRTKRDRMALARRRKRKEEESNQFN